MRVVERVDGVYLVERVLDLALHILQPLIGVVGNHIACGGDCVGPSVSTVDSLATVCANPSGIAHVPTTAVCGVHPARTALCLDVLIRCQQNVRAEGLCPTDCLIAGCLDRIGARVHSRQARAVTHKAGGRYLARESAVHELGAVRTEVDTHLSVPACVYGDDVVVAIELQAEAQADKSTIARRDLSGTGDVATQLCADEKIIVSKTGNPYLIAKTLDGVFAGLGADVSPQARRDCGCRYVVFTEDPRLCGVARFTVVPQE